MDSNRSRVGILVGVGVAAGCLGVAAMMSAATAPTARADAYSDIIAAIDGDFADGQAAFTIAASDFGSNEFVPGLAALFSGVDDDLVSAPDNLLAGTVEALTNESVTGSQNLSFSAPASFADSVTAAGILVSEGEGLITDGAAFVSGGDYGDAIFIDILGGTFVSAAPLEELILGAAASL
jgi:hypothetical protein